MGIELDPTIVYVSDLLAVRFPSVYDGLGRLLAGRGLGLATLAGTRDIWCRDYMPVPAGRDGSFVLFRYAPDYLRGRYRGLITDARPLLAAVPEIHVCEPSDIVLDGGNVVRDHGRAIVTHKVFSENPGRGRAELAEELRRLLRVDALVVIPTEPGDVVGHADGVARFAADGTALIHDHANVDPAYGRRLRRAIERAGLRVAEVPYRPWAGRCRGVPPATGNYLNFLRAIGLVVVPVYGYPEDEEAVRVLRGHFPDSDIVPLDCTELAAEGGAVNCVTWDPGAGVGDERHGRPPVWQGPAQSVADVRRVPPQEARATRPHPAAGPGLARSNRPWPTNSPPSTDAPA